MNLLLLTETDRLDSDRFTLSDARATHLLTVLRVTPGQVVRVGLIDGPFGIGTVETTEEGRVTLQCGACGRS